MSPLIRLEMRRALGNRLTLTCLVIGVALALAAAVEATLDFWTFFDEGVAHIEETYADQFAKGAFTEWMPMAVMRSVPNLFFFSAPLLIGLSYAWSWRSDVRKGYAASILTRAPRAEWDRAKGLATFVVSGIVVAVPLLVNLAVVLCLVPAYPPDIVGVVYTGLWTKVFLSNLFYTCAPAYVAVRVVLDFVLAGLWGTTVLALSRFMRNRVAIVALPYIGLIAIKYVSENLYVLSGVQLGALTILDQLKARGDQFYYDWGAVALGLAVMLLVSVAVPRLTRGRDVL